MKYYAHTMPGTDERHWHLLRDHLINTGELAAQFAGKFGAGELGRIAGLLHDIGKYSIPFQKQLRGSPVVVDHAAAGAKEVISLYGKALGRILAYIIAGNGSGLPDYGSPGRNGSLAARLQKPVPDYSAYVDEISAMLPNNPPAKLPMKTSCETAGFSLQFFIRMLFSCLLDADCLDIESAIYPLQFAARKRTTTMCELKSRLDRYLKELESDETAHDNQLQAEILARSREAGAEPPGLFTLTVPAGSGRTLASLAFALNHAVHNGLQRVIRVSPFHTMLEYTAAQLRTAIGDDAVMEHHSNFSPTTNEEESPFDHRLRLAQDNWDVPVVVTTNVQFFESLFSHHSGRCRKLHNIAGSVVVLDEPQMIPTPYLLPCLWAVNELVQNYNVTVVLSSTTQPRIPDMLPQVVPVKEISPNSQRFYEEFRRVRVNWLGEVDDDTLSSTITKHRQVLCIVNTRSHAASIYEAIRGEGVYHLSTRMYPAHRSRKLDEIRTELNQGEECRVISTPLIEAGVDINFPVVYRALAGVDSIAQAAARCNGVGRESTGEVNVFRPENRHIPRGWFEGAATITGLILRDYDDPLSPEAIDTYFHLLFESGEADLDRDGILKLFTEGAAEVSFPFRQVGEEFQLIDRPMAPVIIPRDPECIAVLDEARWKGPSLNATRELQHFVVQIYAHEFAELSRQGALELVAGQYTVLRDLSLYDDEVGLLVPGASQIDEVLLY